jgi:hypothetical protein
MNQIQNHNNNHNQNTKHDTKKKDGKHKLTQECLTKCIKWKLNVTLSHNKNSSGIVN